MPDEIRQTLIIEAELTKIRADFAHLKSDFASAVTSMQNDARRLNSSVETGFTKLAGVGRNLGSVFGALGIGLSVAGVVSFAKSVVDLGDKLSDLSDQTGLSIDVLGGIRVIAEQSGSSLESFAKGINRAQKEIGGLDESGKKLLESLGLSQKELAASSPDEFLEKLARALGTVENRYQRQADGAKLLGKSFAELGPTIDYIAEHGLPRLQKETADAYRNLGQLKDQSDALKAKLFDLGAQAAVTAGQIFGLIPLSEIQELGKAAEKVDFLSGSFGRLKGISKAAIDAKTLDQLREMERSIPDKGAVLNFISPSGKKTLQDLIAAREEQEKLLAAANRPKAPTDTRGNVRAPAATDDKGKAALDNYRDSLIKLITQQETEKIKLTLGEQAALEAAQAYDVLALRAKLAADKVPIPPELNDAATRAKTTLGSLGANVATLGEKNLLKLQEGALAGADGIEILKKRMDDLAAVGKMMNQDSAEWINVDADLDAAQKKTQELRKEFQSLGKDITLDLLNESDRRREIIDREYADRVEQIRKLAAETNTSEEATSALIFKAAEARNKKIGELSEDTSEFMRRAYERGFDAVADGLKDLLDNGATSFGDFAEKIRKTLNSLLADAATLELKKILLGANYGSQSGGQMGGMLGQLLGSTGGASVGYGSRPAGVEGPSMANGGFFSNIIGSIFSSLFKHDGGPITPIRMHGGGEVPIIAQTGEYMINRRAARTIGRDTLDRINMVGDRSIVGAGYTTPNDNDARGRAGGDVHITQNFTGVTDADSFRRSRAQMLADLTRAVEKGKRHL